jgi:hypothetical protein
LATPMSSPSSMLSSRDVLLLRYACKVAISVNCSAERGMRLDTQLIFDGVATRLPRRTVRWVHRKLAVELWGGGGHFILRGY